MKRWQKVTAIVAGTGVLLAAGAGAAYAVRKQIIVNGACAEIARYLAEEGQIQTVGTGAKRIVVLGDSYVAGDGLTDRTARWANVLAETEAATVTIDGIGGTGFVNGGCTSQTFADRASVLNRPADVVIVSGGLNDLAASPAELRAGAEQVLQSISWSAPVFVVGPPTTPARGAVAWVDEVLGDVATEHGATYVSAAAWDLPYLDDATHLSVEGHTRYAEYVAAALN